LENQPGADRVRRPGLIDQDEREQIAPPMDDD
jgi:hypothetical protein